MTRGKATIRKKNYRTTLNREQSLYNSLRPKKIQSHSNGYYVEVMTGGRHAYAPTVVEAKRIGTQLARLTANSKTKWYNSYGVVHIYKVDKQGHHSGIRWTMTFQLTIRSARPETDVEFKRSHGHAPYTWFKDDASRTMRRR